MIQFLWICWFLYTAIICLEFTIKVLSGLIWNNPFYSDDTEENVKNITSLQYLMCMMYQLYFWLDYIGFWKQVLQ